MKPATYFALFEAKKKKLERSPKAEHVVAR